MLTINNSPEFLNTKEAAKMLGVSENSLRIRVCRGQIRSYKVFSRLRFKPSDLEDCIKELPSIIKNEEKENDY